MNLHFLFLHKLKNRSLFLCLFIADKLALMQMRTSSFFFFQIRIKVPQNCNDYIIICDFFRNCYKLINDIECLCGNGQNRKGRWFKSECEHLMLYIVSVDLAQNGNQLSIAGSSLVMDWCPVREESMIDFCLAHTTESRHKSSGPCEVHIAQK